MSWSVGISAPADEAIEKIEQDNYIPISVGDHMIDGIKALKLHHGDGVKVNVSGSGHLHNGKDGNANTFVNFTVAKAAE